MPGCNLYRAGHYAAYCHLLAPGSQLQVGWALTREPKWKQRTLDLTGRPGYHYLGRLALIGNSLRHFSLRSPMPKELAKNSWGEKTCIRARLKVGPQVAER